MRARLTRWLLGCQTGGKRLRAGLLGSWTLGNKTGNNGRDAVGDIGIAWPPAGTPILISVYAQGGTPTQTQIDQLFARLGRDIAARL